MVLDPSRVRSLPDVGTIYETLTVTDVWGSLEVMSGGALITEDFRAILLPAPTGVEGPELTGDGYSVSLDSPWSATEPNARGDVTLAR